MEKEKSTEDDRLPGEKDSVVGIEKSRHTVAISLPKIVWKSKVDNIPVQKVTKF